jgi:1,3-beta-glucan synthase
LLPSRQIRPPIYSLKQSKLRKRRVVRFAILYFFMLVVFVVLIAAPLVIRDLSSISYSIRHALYDAVGVKSGGLGLLQPLDAGLNDTQSYYTGSHLPQGYKSPVNSATPTAGDFNFHRMI